MNALAFATKNSCMSEIEFFYEGSSELARAAARRFIVRRYGARLLFMGVSTMACLILMIIGIRPWYVISAFTFGCVALLIWVNYYRSCDKAFASMNDPRVSIRISESQIVFETSEQKSEYQWSRFRNVWRFSDVWLFFTYTDDTFVLIPTECLTPEAQELIETQVRESGGRVR